jgi:hypothetical protein
MSELGERARLPLLNIEEGDVGVLISGPLTGLALGSLFGGGVVLIACLAVGLLLSVMAIYAAPSHLTAWAWLRDLSRFGLFSPRVIRSHPLDGQRAATGALLGWTPLVTDETTATMTGIDRLWVENEQAIKPFGIVQRSDGVMQAFIEIRPSNMDFAMSGDWATVHSLAEHFVNTEIESPLTFHATTRTFPVETMLQRIETRLQDRDVRASSVLQSLLEEYRERRQADLAGRQQLHYYLRVEVGQLDVYTRHEQEQTPSEKLTHIPLLGVLFTPFVTRRARYSQADLRAAMFEKLDTRLRTVEREFIEKVPGWTALRLDGAAALDLTAGFWSGEEYAFEALPEADLLGVEHPEAEQ